MNRSDYIHELGPEKIAELLEAYDELFNNLVDIPIQIWESEQLFKKLNSTNSIERMREMRDVYEYVFELEKALAIETWLDCLECTCCLLEAKRILEYDL